MNHFELVYGIEAQLSSPLELAATKLQKVIEDETFYTTFEKRVFYLAKTEEERENMVDHITNHQARVKNFFDHKARLRKFMLNEKVLLWDKRKEPHGAHGKFESLWKGPFEINKCSGPILST